MRQPRGFVHPKFPPHVYKLRKAIYGLKQALKAWFYHFSSFLLSHGFSSSSADPFMFVTRNGAHIVLMILS